MLKKQPKYLQKHEFLFCLLKSPPSLFLSNNIALSLSFPSVNLGAVISAGLADLTQEDGNIWILFSKIILLCFSLPYWHTHKTVRAESPTFAPPNITSVLVFPRNAEVSALIFYRNIYFYTHEKAQLRSLK